MSVPLSLDPNPATLVLSQRLDAAFVVVGSEHRSKASTFKADVKATSSREKGNDGWAG
jgi:hypothetical protein